MNQPSVFISCVSPEFQQTRSRVVAILTRLGYAPVIQEIFGTEAGDLRQVLRDKTDACQGLIQIVGHGYGAESPTVDGGYDRVSYTQFEFLYARAAGKKDLAPFRRRRLRVSEAIDLRRYEVDLAHARLWIRRLKRGLDVEHPIAGDELRAIKRCMPSRTDALPWLFISERGQPFTRQPMNYLLAEAAARAGLPPVHPHMQRHSWGFSLANRGSTCA